MIARELLLKFQMSDRHPLVMLRKAYKKFLIHGAPVKSCLPPNPAQADHGERLGRGFADGRGGGSSWCPDAVLARILRWSGVRRQEALSSVPAGNDASCIGPDCAEFAAERKVWVNVGSIAVDGPDRKIIQSRLHA